MGLDMYLKKKIYVGANYEHNKVEGKISLTKDGQNINIPINKITYIELDYGYWRKDNHIHRWFVDNVQDGIDDCRDAFVTIENLQNLKSVCQETKDYLDSRPKILSDDSEDYFVYDVDPEVMEELLPTQSGFFFGGTDYDDWYYNSLESTIEIIDECIRSEEEHVGEYYYQSSW